MNSTPIQSTHIGNYPLFRRGKVRESYDLGDRLLMIATDRISAYDVIMLDGIPDKGRILSQLSAFWFDLTCHLVDNHLLSTDLETVGGLTNEEKRLYSDRSIIARKAERIDIECVVRGHVSGSAWTEYKATCTIADIPQPPQLIESQKLPEPIFTPAIKSDSGHDQNISVTELRDRIGDELAGRLERVSLDLYGFAYDYAQARDVIIADTKFEFGFVGDDLILIDEILTPDSSRFWNAESFAPGGPQASFDKQYLRDWLTTSGWDREPPPPRLPDEVVEGTANRYRQAYERLTGLPWVSSSTTSAELNPPRKEVNAT